MSETPHRPTVSKGHKPQRRPDLDSLFSVNPDGSRNVLHPADVRGRFQRRKNLLWLLLIAVYVAVPWLTIGGRPLVLIDIQNRHFHLLGNTFNAQDFWLAFFFVTGLGFALFVTAALFGRMWCGYACPQTVFLEGVFRRIERWLEGGAPARMRLDKAPISAGKLLRRGIKHALFLAVSLLLSHAFLGYFMPVGDVLRAVVHAPGEHVFAFVFTMAFTAVIYFNFAFFREQLCIVVCPYGRLQGALYDADTILVGYDRTRGEPRGPVGTQGAGDCVDCFRCVAVCPTGIDIRNGTQMECVGCANCIDACDEVMQRIGRPAGLVRYDSQRGLEGGGRRFWRPRVLLYAVMLIAGLAAFAVAAGRRTPFEVALQRGATTYTLADGVVQSTVTLHLVNKLPGTQTFAIARLGPPEAEVVVAEPNVTLDSLAQRRITVVVRVPEGAFVPHRNLELEVTTATAQGELRRTASLVLLGPGR